VIRLYQWIFINAILIRARKPITSNRLFARLMQITKAIDKMRADVRNNSIKPVKLNGILYPTGIKKLPQLGIIDKRNHQHTATFTTLFTFRHKTHLKRNPPL